MIYIIGIGPGNDIDYLTLKAFKTIKSADIGIYIGEMIGEGIKELFKNKELKTGRNIDKTKVKSIINNAYKKDKKIALLMPGDTSVYSGQFNEQYAVNEYINFFNKNNYKFEIIPGISSMNALCAKSKIDLTAFTNSQNIFTTSIERLKDIKQFNETEIKKILSTKPNIIFYQSYRDWQLIKELLAENYKPNTKIVFAFKISWKDEIIIETSLENAEKDIKGKELNKHTIIIILQKI